MNIKQKLYCYVDESGQDTNGLLFIVSVIVAKENRIKLRATLEDIEKTSKKGKTKWVNTRKEFKIAYFERVLACKEFLHTIFYSFSKETKAYKEITLITIASAVTASKDQENYETNIFIDGLQRSEINKVATGLRRIGVRTEKVRGIKDEADAFIRLADAVAGLIREEQEDVKYAVILYKLSLSKKVVTSV